MAKPVPEDPTSKVGTVSEEIQMHVLFQIVKNNALRKKKKKTDRFNCVLAPPANPSPNSAKKSVKGAL